LINLVNIFIKITTLMYTFTVSLFVHTCIKFRMIFNSSLYELILASDYDEVIY
jgi:hypothetical protein